MRTPAAGRGWSPRWSLRWQLFSAFVALSLATLAAGGFVGARLLDRAVAHAATLHMHFESLRVAAVLERSWREVDPSPRPSAPLLALARGLLGAVARSSGSTVLLVAPGGQVLLSTARFGRIAPDNLRQLTAWATHGELGRAGPVVLAGGTVVAAAAPVRVHGRLRAVVVVGQSLRTQEAARALVSAMLLRAGAVAVLFSLALAVVVAERIAGRARAVAAAAGRLSHGHLRERVPLRGSDELTAMARAFNEMAERLEAAVRGRQELVAAVSHELRTPLTSVQGYVQALRDGAVAPGEVPRVYRVVDAELARLRRLIEDLFELSRWDAGRLRPVLQEVDASELLLSAVERGRILAGADGPRVVAEPGPAPGRLWVDPDRVFQVLSNFVQNAVRFTPAGGTITLRARGEADGVRFEVEDTGTGIPAEELPHVFERFHTGEPSRARPTAGTGLGLAIAAEIVRAHGGRIGVESPPGGGALFWCELPRRSVAAPDGTADPRDHGSGPGAVDREAR